MTIAGIDEGNLTGSLNGLRVLDFSTTIAGPHCTRMLADLGAEVIKIETAEGETMRTRPPMRNDCSTAFGQLNIGKKSLVLDLKSREGIEVVRRLVAGAVKLDGKDDKLGPLRAGEVVELTVHNGTDFVSLIEALRRQLIAQDLTPVSVGRLMRDAGVSV